MYFKHYVAALLASSAILVTASPQPDPTPAPEVGDLQQRQIINSLTSVAGSIITGAVPSVISQATSVAGSIGSEITSVGGSILTQVTSAGGAAFTIVTSVGGEAITLATSGAGVATSAFGSIYTVATAAAQNSNNAALGMHVVGLSSPAFAGLVTVAGGALLGAVIAL